MRTTDLDRILNLKSVAIFGASNDPAKYGYTTLNSIIRQLKKLMLFPLIFHLPFVSYLDI